VGRVIEDVIGPDARVTATGELARALDALTVVGVDAGRFEAEGVARSEVDVLADAGVLSAGLVPGWTPANTREVHEQLAAASGALWFVVTQHRSPATAAATTANDALRGRWADELSRGRALGAVAFAHLRRPGPPSVTATRVTGGWRIDGRLDWITSWGLADVLLLMAESPDGDVVQALLPASGRDGLRITGELSLAAMQGTSTVGAVLEGLLVDDGEVAHQLPKESWLAEDTQRTANAPPALFGLVRVVLNALSAAAAERGSPNAASLADRWSDELRAMRSRAYQLVDEVEPGGALDERRELRARITRLAQDASSALIAVRGGRAMLTSSPEQRWARESLFALVQAQTAATREGYLATFSPA
jgi:alkylation response protein AidB-like acyl-CoA dehydrogenase